MISDATNRRKIEHIDIIGSDPDVDRRMYHFDSIRLVHRALPEINFADVNPGTDLLGKHLSFPLLISSMTGGDHALIEKINRNLAAAAEETGVAMAVGSQRVMFTTPAARTSFEIRGVAPNALLFSNLGAVQLNYGFTVDTCRDAMAALDADGIFLHLNPLQEVVQPEGDTNFSGLAAKIGAVVKGVDKAVIVKEVGAGISPADAVQLLAHGVRYIDVAGAGGTSWSRIEHHRNHNRGADESIGLMFQDWGIPTPLALSLLKPYRDRLTLFGSGGLRSAVDMVKAVILGASLCGMASPFLKPARESKDAVIDAIMKLKKEFTTTMFLLGVKDIATLHGNESLILNTTHIQDTAR